MAIADKAKFSGTTRNFLGLLAQNGRGRDLPAVIAGFDRLYALKTGVVDCMDLTKSAYVGFKLHEVVPWLIETGHIWAPGVIYVSAPFWTSPATL